jgi:hypothetical protein
MSRSEPGRPPRYLLTVLADGARPFGYRPAVRNLLGTPAGGGITPLAGAGVRAFPGLFPTHAPERHVSPLKLESGDWRQPAPPPALTPRPAAAEPPGVPVAPAARAPEQQTPRRAAVAGARPDAVVVPQPAVVPAAGTPGPSPDVRPPDVGPLDARPPSRRVTPLAPPEPGPSLRRETPPPAGPARPQSAEPARPRLAAPLRIEIPGVSPRELRRENAQALTPAPLSGRRAVPPPAESRPVHLLREPAAAQPPVQRRRPELAAIPPDPPRTEPVVTPARPAMVHPVRRVIPAAAPPDEPLRELPRPVPALPNVRSRQGATAPAEAEQAAQRTRPPWFQPVPAPVALTEPAEPRPDQPPLRAAYWERRLGHVQARLRSLR